MRSAAAQLTAGPAATRPAAAPARYDVRPEWIDYNGHMTESRYLQVFGDAMDALYPQRRRR